MTAQPDEPHTDELAAAYRQGYADGAGAEPPPDRAFDPTQGMTNSDDRSTTDPAREAFRHMMERILR